jgi:uncharacterized protein
MPGLQATTERLARALLRRSVAHPRRVLLLWALAALASALFIPEIELELDGRSLIPPHHRSQVESDRAAELFDSRDVVVVGLTAAEPGGVYRPAVLALLRDLSHRLQEIDGIVPGSVTSLATLPRLFVEQDTLAPEPLLSAEHVPDEELARRLRRETRALGLDDGVLVTADGRAAAIYAEVASGASRKAVLERVRELVAGAADSGVSIYLTGTALAQAILGWAAASDLIRLIPFVLVVLAVVLTLVFRHPAPAAASLAEVGLSLVVTAGVMGAVGASVFVTTLVLPVILLVIGVSDDVYALDRFCRRARREPHRPIGEVAVESFTSVAHPIVLTTVTTVVGLLSLTATELVPQRVFGLFGSVALLVSTALTFTLVPAMLVLSIPGALPAPRRRPVARTAAWFGRLERLGPRRTLIATVLAFVGLAMAARGLSIEDDWVRNLPPGSDVARGQEVLDRELAGTLRLELAVDSGRPEGVLSPETFLALGRLEEVLRSTPGVGAVEGPFSDVTRVWASLEGRRYEEVRRELLAGGRRPSAAEIDQALLLLSALRDSPLGQRIDPELRHARVVTLLSDASYRRIGGVLEAVRRASGPFERVVPFGDGWISHQAVALLVVGQVRSVGFALLADLLLLWLVFRSARHALLAIAPIVFAVVSVFALLALAEVPLGIANSMFAAIALGIGVDYSIHLVERYRRLRVPGAGPRDAMAAAFEHAAPAILYSALAVAAGLLVLALSHILPNLQLGLLVCVSLTLCALATLVVVPCLVLSGRAADPERSPDPRVGRRVPTNR